ncbi:MAG: hypothetical protein COA43_15360 [Robiginitomaculum sp.]|nr:MAG: hypothetical protein COA43_15360 [Robiginitomaculum sp.]
MMFNIAKYITLTVIAGLSLSACEQQTVAPAPIGQSKIQSAENKMVVLPRNMALGSAVIHPPRSVNGFGSTEAQTIGALTGLHTLLQKQGLNLSHVMRLRVILVAGENAGVDYTGFNSGYKKFYGTQKLPNEPLNIISEAKSLPVQGQLVLIEVDIAVPVKDEKDTQE